MTTTITAIFDSPTDPDTFEAGQMGLLELARALPGLERLETSKVWPKEDGSPVPAYRILGLYFADYETASTAVASPAADAFLSCALAMATGGVRIVFADVEQT